MTGWHISSSRNREGIQTKGLLRDAVEGWDAGWVWIFVDLEIARQSATQGCWGGRQDPVDIWEVDLSGLEIVPDPHQGWGDERDDVARATRSNIGPDRIRLLTTV